MKRLKTMMTALVMVVTVCILLITTTSARAASSGTSKANRFNVVLVLDTSGSMHSSDPEGNRFEAINQFSALLSEQGNVLGGVVFSDTVNNTEGPIEVNSQSDKDKVTGMLQNATVDGDTNIGDALSQAVTMLEEGGNQSLPSVIVLLSDGNTDLSTDDAMQASLQTKADALQKAHQDGIRIYSICLNADGSADTSEMKQISDSADGVFQEVQRAEDLQDVFNAFYALIYGGDTVQLTDTTIPDSGVLETSFEVPNMGVEEVNIVIYGNATSYTLVHPNGTEETPSVIKGNTFSLIKISDIESGTWTLRTTGVPGDRIHINMVYNTSLEVEATVDPNNRPVNPADELTFSAHLKTDGTEVTQDSLLEGYSAKLVLLDDAGNEVSSQPMSQKDASFVYAGTLQAGNYHYRVDVSGYNMNRSSEVNGPVVISENADTNEYLSNKGPEAVANPKVEDQNVWPFFLAGFFDNNRHYIDLTTLATDDQSEPLTYSIVSTTFKDSEYSRDGDKITITGYSMPKSSFTIRATDKWGASCDIEVIINSHNVALMMAIGLVAGILIALVVAAILLRIALTKPFRGTVAVSTMVNGNYAGGPAPRSKSRGRIKLSIFNLDQTGLDYQKSYIQATGQREVLLRTDIPVPYQGTSTKDVRVLSGTPTTIYLPNGSQLTIRFDSNVPTGMRPKGVKRPKAPKPPKQPRVPKAPRNHR